MNIYFLVEGKRTEPKVYSSWLQLLCPNMKAIQNFDDVDTNNFYIFSGEGYPSMLDHIVNSIEDINHIKKYDYFLICLDADDKGVEGTEQEILKFLNELEVKINPNTTIKILVQNICIETWFLGNKKIVTRNTENKELAALLKHFNVADSDPEKMKKTKKYIGSNSQYHAFLLEKLFQEKKIKYTKKDCKDVLNKTYLDELIKRSKDTQHIQSFQKFIDFCKIVSSSTAL